MAIGWVRPKPTYVPLETGGNQRNGLAAKAHFDADELNRAAERLDEKARELYPASLGG